MADKFGVIEFEEYPDEWYRVRLSPVPLSRYRDVVAAYKAAGESGILADELVALLKVFIPVVDSWSHEAEVSLDALLELDPNLLFALVGQWINGVRSVPLPLPRRSSDGAPSADPETSPSS